MLNPCQCQSFPYEPVYCEDYDEAHPEERPPWTPTILCDDPLEIGDLDLLEDGVRYQVLSKEKYDDLQILKCKKNTYLDEKIGDHCIYHEYLRSVEEKRHSVDKAREGATRVPIQTDRLVPGMFIGRRNTIIQDKKFRFTWKKEVGNLHSKSRSVIPVHPSNFLNDSVNKEEDTTELVATPTQDDPFPPRWEKDVERSVSKRQTKIFDPLPTSPLDKDRKEADTKKIEEIFALKAASLLGVGRKESQDLTSSNASKKPDSAWRGWEPLPQRSPRLVVIDRLDADIGGPPTPAAVEPKKRL